MTYIAKEESIQRAINYYKELATIRDWSLGPKWRFSKTDQNQANQLMKNIYELLNGFSFDENNTIHLPSVWHAALFCSFAQHSSVIQAGYRFVFRGHGDSEWDIGASLFRDGVDQEYEVLKADVFEHILSSLSFNTMMMFGPEKEQLYLRIGPNSYKAAAQHYGIKTNLVDFTTDADVATWFATTPSDNLSKYSCVHMLSLSEDLLSHTTMILPPPFVERLHLQRGLFLSSNESTSFSKIQTQKVQFPNPNLEHFEKYKSNFEVMRDKGNPVDILSSNYLFLPIFQEMELIFKKGKIPKAQEDLEIMKHKLKKHFMFLYKDPINYWAEYVEHYEDFLYQTVYSIPKNEDHLFLNEVTFEKIIVDNPELSGSVVSMYEYLFNKKPENQSEEQAVHFNSIMSFITNTLKRKGYSHQENADRYSQFMMGKGKGQ